MEQYKNIRDAKDGDPGFKKGANQVIVTLEDGTEKTIALSELLTRPPDATDAATPPVTKE